MNTECLRDVAEATALIGRNPAESGKPPGIPITPVVVAKEVDLGSGHERTKMRDVKGHTGW